MLSDLVARGRAAAAALMLDTLEFGEMDTAPGPDGFEVDTFVPAITDVPGKISGNSRDGDQTIRTVTIGGTERPVISGGLHIPADRPETIPAGTYVRVADLGPDSPEHLLGRIYRIEGESVKSYQTARRFDVVEV